MPHSELNKISEYFAEGRNLWEVNPDLVLSFQFFELWEQVQQPRPFHLDAEEMEVVGQLISLSSDDDKIAYFKWDHEEQCAALQVEGRSMDQKALLFFRDGEPEVVETPPLLHEQDGLSYGERLEVMYDVIAHLRSAENGGADPAGLTKKEFLQVLENMNGRYEKKVMRVMRRLTLPFIKRLISRAMEDMAADEVSGQLALPLDGTYAVAADTDRKGLLPGGAVYSVPRRSTNQVLFEIKLLQEASAVADEMEKGFAFALAGADITAGDDSSARDLLGICVKTPADLPVEEGHRLPVYDRSESQSVGRLDVDFCDGGTLYGRLHIEGAEKDEIRQLLPRLYAEPLPSPRGFIMQSLKALHQLLTEAPEVASPAQAAVLGLKEVSCTQRSAEVPAPAFLDPAQAGAWQSAVNPDEPVVLIQGPPGTGKTALLEQVVKSLCAQHKRILFAAPSNAAVDNVCRRVLSMPLLRLGKSKNRISPEIAETCWIGEADCNREFARKFSAGGGEMVFAGTPVGVLREQLVHEEVEAKGLFDVFILDEAGMASMDEFLLCAQLADRVVLFGDHQQLPPFPLAPQVLAGIDGRMGPLPRHSELFVTKSSLEWLAEVRGFPVQLLQSSYRCQNPRLMRFASTLFYDARVKPSQSAEYYRLPFNERQKRYPAATLRIFRTSRLPARLKHEHLVLQGSKPGLENRCEALLCCRGVYECLQRYPFDEITVIAPYKRQVRVLRKLLSQRQASEAAGRTIGDEEWRQFLFSRVSTVDSFQGGESDAVIICYVRSNDGRGIGFVDDPNRVNVAHTRCRREMLIVGDLDCLKKHARNQIFHRLERAVERDGEIIDVPEQWLEDTLQVERNT